MLPAPTIPDPVGSDYHLWVILLVCFAVVSINYRKVFCLPYPFPICNIYPWVLCYSGVPSDHVPFEWDNLLLFPMGYVSSACAGNVCDSKKLCHFTTHPYAGPVGNNRISDWVSMGVVIVVGGWDINSHHLSLLLFGLGLVGRNDSICHVLLLPNTWNSCLSPGLVESCWDSNYLNPTHRC